MSTITSKFHTYTRAPLFRAVLAVLALALIATGCAGEEETPAASDGALSTADAAEPQEPTEASWTSGEGCDPEGLTITIQHWSDSEERGHAMAATVVEDAHPGLSIELQQVTAGTYQEQMQTVVADVAANSSADMSQYGLGMVTFAQAALDPRPVPTDALPEGYDPRFLPLGTVDGDLISVPHSVSVPLWYYNKDAFEAAGLDPEEPPTTYAETLEAARTLADANVIEHPIHLGYDGVGDWFFQNAVQAGGALLAEDGQPAFNTDGAVEGLELWTTVLDEGLMPRIGLIDALDQFVQGDIGVYALSNANLNLLADRAESFEMGVFMHPVVEGVTPRWGAGGDGFSIWTEEDCRAFYSLEFLRELLSPELTAQAAEVSGYPPANRQGNDLLEEYYADNPNNEFAAMNDDELTLWNGFAGEGALEANLALVDAMQLVADGESAQSVVDSAYEDVTDIVGD